MKSAKYKSQNSQILISTFNVRTLSNSSYLSEFASAIKQIKYDVIGLSEVKRIGEERTKEDGFIFYHFGVERKRGVGFAINLRWEKNIKSLQSFSDRVAVLILQVNDKDTLGIIQVYAPTSKASDSTMDEFYNDVEKALELMKKTSWHVVMGDFNQKIGSRSAHENDVLGSFGYGTRNERGERLIRFCRKNQLLVANTLFKKKPNRKWTWSLDLKTRNEIDFILTPHRDCVKNVEVLNKVKFESDHRLVRATSNLHKKFKHYKSSHIPRLIINPFDAEAIGEFNHKSIDALKSAEPKSVADFQDVLLKAAENFRKLKNQHPVITIPTRKLIETREKLRSLALTDHSKKIEYYVARKLAKKEIKRDVRNYELLLLDNAIRNNRCLKVARNGIEKKKNFIISLKDENGSTITDRDGVLNIAATFYQGLYKSKMSEDLAKNIEPELNERAKNIN